MKGPTQPQPPKLATRLLRSWSKGADIEDLLGDMEEEFDHRLLKDGKLSAQLSYHRHAVSLILSYSLKRRKQSAAYSHYYHSSNLSMISSYFKIAIRNFSKHKLFTSVNIFGLALGMSICLLALSITVAIYRSDEYHENKDRIHQVNTYIWNEQESKTFGSTFPAVADYMKAKYPFIEQTVKIKSGFSPEFNHHGNTISFDGYFAGASFFEVFSFPLISGDPRTALDKPFSIILTQSVAETLYKEEDPIGKSLETEQGTYLVTGVMADLKQTHFYFDLLTSHSTYEQLAPDTNLATDWFSYRNNYLYLLVQPGTNELTLSEALAQVSATASEFNPNHTIELESVSLSNVVPRWNISNAIGIGWDQPSIYFFLSIGLLILLPAVFNYTNLSIARALKRAKEIGIRKVVGADKGQIKAQFIVETVLLAFLALLGSILIFIPLRQEFLDLVRAAEVLDTSMGATQITVFVLFTLLVGLFAGIFPARYFSRLNPIHTMKGSLSSGAASVSGIKKGLFVFQFFVSLVFIIGVGAIAKQYSYVLNQNHGFESDNVLTVPFKNIDKQVAINELSAHPDVKAITTASSLPGILIPTTIDVTPNELDTIPVSQVFIGEQFIPNMGMKLIWGESQQLSQSTQNEELVLVNEQFLKSAAVFNVQSDSLTFTLADGTPCRIVGILEDFNFEPLDRLIRPLLFRYSLEQSQYALLTINSSDIKGTIDDLDALWSGIDQEIRFDAVFLDDEIEKAYSFLRAQIKIFSYLSALAITISCLGLLGMVAYTTENRTKEIAIRKIMGATNQSLYYLLTKDFIKLIGISALIAIPFSYLFYDKLFLYFLLRYGSGLGVTEVVVSILFLLVVGFASIYWQTAKVAHTNPSKNLRYE
ncbi:MAG: FtsX-like permease family protein [Cyclobacteriaceae bacterium]